MKKEVKYPRINIIGVNGEIVKSYEAAHHYFICYQDDRDCILDIFYKIPAETNCDLDIPNKIQNVNDISSYCIYKDMLIDDVNYIREKKILPLKEFINEHKDEIENVDIMYDPNYKLPTKHKSGDGVGIVKITVSTKRKSLSSIIELDPRYVHHTCLESCFETPQPTMEQFVKDLKKANDENAINSYGSKESEKNKEGKLKEPIVILRDIMCGLEVVNAVKPYFRCYLDTNDETKFIEVFYTFPDSNVIYSYSLSKDMLIGKFEDVIRDRVTSLKIFVDKHRDDLKEISITYNSNDEEAVIEIVIKSKGDFTYSRFELDPNYSPQIGLGVVEEDDEDFYNQEEPEEQVETVKEENKSCIFTSKEQDDIFKFHMAVEEFDKIMEKLSMHRYNGTKLEDEFRHSTLFRSLIPKINHTTLTLIVYHAINKMTVLSEDVVTIIMDKELMTEEELSPLYDYFSNIIDHFTLYVETCDLYYDNLIHFMVTRGPVRNVAKDIVDDIIKKYIDTK